MVKKTVQENLENIAKDNHIQYFIEKYGDKDGTKKYKDINSKKAQSVSNFIERYGEIDGIIKYESYLCSHQPFYSKPSQELFWKIYKRLPNILQEKCYFAELNKEFGKYDEVNNNYYMYDFTISNIKYIIEYNGVHWHAKPSLYTIDDTVYKIRGKPMKVSKIWEKEDMKLGTLTRNNFEYDVVWDDEDADVDKILNKIMVIYETYKNNK